MVLLYNNNCFSVLFLVYHSKLQNRLLTQAKIWNLQGTTEKKKKRLLLATWNVPYSILNTNRLQIPSLIFYSIYCTTLYVPVSKLRNTVVPYRQTVQVLSLQPMHMIPPKRFDIPPPLTGGCSEGLDAFRFFMLNTAVQSHTAQKFSLQQALQLLQQFTVNDIFIVYCRKERRVLIGPW